MKGKKKCENSEQLDNWWKKCHKHAKKIKKCVKN